MNGLLHARPCELVWVAGQARSVEPRGAGSWERGSPEPWGHSLPWEERDPAHTGAPHRTTWTELQDSNWGLLSQESSLHGPGLRVSRPAAVMPGSTHPLPPSQLAAMKGLNPPLNAIKNLSDDYLEGSRPLFPA